MTFKCQGDGYTDRSQTCLDLDNRCRHGSPFGAYPAQLCGAVRPGCCRAWVDSGTLYKIPGYPVRVGLDPVTLIVADLIASTMISFIRENS